MKKVKSWVAVNRNPFGHSKKEVIFGSSPFRISVSMEKGSCRSWVCLDGFLKKVSGVELPEGTIEKMIGRKLTWEDGYVCLDGEDNYIQHQAISEKRETMYDSLKDKQVDDDILKNENKKKKEIKMELPIYKGLLTNQDGWDMECLPENLIIENEKKYAFGDLVHKISDNDEIKSFINRTIKEKSGFGSSFEIDNFELLRVDTSTLKISFDSGANWYETKEVKARVMYCEKLTETTHQ